MSIRELLCISENDSKNRSKTPSFFTVVSPEAVVFLNPTLFVYAWRPSLKRRYEHRRYVVGLEAAASSA